MPKAFQKAIAFSDIHFGLKHNSREHNQDCENFIQWMIQLAKKENCETCLFLGDYHHHRASVNVSTLNYMVRGLQLLNDNFKKVYFIVGNHDMFYREKRDMHSLPMAQQFENITIVDKPIIENNIAVLPWLVGDEWNSIKTIQTKYVFGHFELPYFKMNAMVEMPDHGGLKVEHLSGPEMVFSGHFHKRQQKNNVYYIGNPFGHNYADAWDFDRGCMILEWDKQPQFYNYDAGPRYISVELSKLIDNADEYLTPTTYAKVLLDIDISYEEANFLRETFINNYKIRELKLVPQQQEVDNTQSTGNIQFKTVDQIVNSELTEIQSETFNIQKLINIYNEL